MSSSVLFISGINFSKRRTIYARDTRLAEFLLVIRRGISTMSNEFSPTLVGTICKVMSMSALPGNVGFSMSFSFVTIEVRSRVNFSYLLMNGTRCNQPQATYRFDLGVLFKRDG